jgi:hypothetical protein
MTTPPDDPRADEGLVEAMARAIWIDEQRPEPWAVSVCDSMGLEQTGHHRRYRAAARAALAAARSHGGM